MLDFCGLVVAQAVSLEAQAGLLNRRWVTPTEGSNREIRTGVCKGGMPPSWGDRSAAEARGGLAP